MITQEEAAEVERLGALMFSPSDICLILGLVFDDCLGDEVFLQARRRGQLKEEAEVRTSIFQLAKAGSAPAQTLAKQLIDQARVFAAGV